MPNPRQSRVSGSLPLQGCSRQCRGSVSSGILLVLKCIGRDELGGRGSSRIMFDMYLAQENDDVGGYSRIMFDMRGCSRRRTLQYYGIEAIGSSSNQSSVNHPSQPASLLLTVASLVTRQDTQGARLPSTTVLRLDYPAFFFLRPSSIHTFAVPEALLTLHDGSQR